MFSHSQLSYSTFTQGWSELKRLGKSFRKMYPTLFKKRYSSKKYKFGHTTSLRTATSCKAFAHGIFGDNENYNNIKAIVNNVFLSVGI